MSKATDIQLCFKTFMVPVQKQCDSILRGQLYYFLQTYMDIYCILIFS